MNCVRVTFEDGVIYDHLFSEEELSIMSKSGCLVTALTLAEEWRNLISNECRTSESFIVRVEWYAYDFKEVTR